MSLPLGTTSRGRPLSLSEEERSRHIHILGASGTGKSKLIEAMVQADILAGRGLCLIDPHGTLADSVVEWCAALGVEKHRRIHLIDLHDLEWTAGFNPLHVWPGQQVEARVDAMVATCAEVWGGEDLNATPLLSTCLQLMFYALAENRLTLAESLALTESADSGAVRKRLTENLPNPTYADYWREFSTLSRRDFEERFSSSRRRLLRFLSPPPIRRIVGQRERVLNLRAIMDDGDILIVNLIPRGAASHENARLLGALILSELRFCAMGRDPETARRRPFALYVDECYDYLTGDVEHMLDETRKFGLHLVLAHQRLGQLQARSPAIFNGVMAGGQTKIVFGGMTDDDAEFMAREVYRSTFNLERPKHVLDKPVVVDEVPYWLESENSTTSEGSSESFGYGNSWNSMTGSSESLSNAYDRTGSILQGVNATSGLTASESHGGSESASWGTSHGSAQTYGRSQTLKPVRVSLPTAVYSLDEQVHLAIVRLRELPNRAAIVKRRGKPPIRFRPALVTPALAHPDVTGRFVAAVQERSPYTTRTNEANAEIAARADLLGGMVEYSAASQGFWHDDH